jgi:hypothetical protein
MSSNLIKSLAILAMTVILILTNPLNFVGVVKVWYCLPLVLSIGIIYIRPAFGSRQMDVPEEDIRVQAIKSVLRHVLTALTALIAAKAGLGLNIPYVDDIFEFIKYVLGQTDTVVNSIMTLVSFGTMIFGFFKQGLRFELTAKEQLKGRKYPGI